MRTAKTFVPLLMLAWLASPASAHGDLEVNELEVLAIRDFEGMEDSFPWGGFEIWDVYVGEGYNESFDQNGVYFKVNLAGDGTARPPGGESALWTLNIRFKADAEEFERQLTHDGQTITTTFESLQWMVADGNVLQIKAWVPIENAIGKNVTDIVLVSSVDDDPRDTAPGGVHDPAAAEEVPVTGPGTGVFPPLGEGRIVEQVHLTGPAKFLNVTIEPRGNATFAITTTNVLKEQGQHVILTGDMHPSWNLTTDQWGKSLDGGASTTFLVTLRTDAPPGALIEPLPLDFLTDIGGRRTITAFLGDAGVELTPEPTLARAATLPDAERSVPIGATSVILVAMATLALLRRKHGT